MGMQALIATFGVGATEAPPGWELPIIVIGDSSTTKWKGANLRMPTGYTPYEWDNFYYNLNSIFDVWVGGAIDHGVDNLGLNGIRLIGDVQAVTRGVLSLETYLARYERFIDHCIEKGVYVYACGGDPNHMKQEDLTLATLSEVTDVIVAFAQMCDTKENVIAIDLMQEVNGWPDAAGTIGAASEATVINACQTIYNAVKEAGVTKPVTFSFANVSNTSYFTASLPTSVEPYCDFMDFHMYIGLFDPSTDLTGALSYGKPLVIGETGMSWTNADRTDQIQNLVDHQYFDDQYRGVFWWHLADNNPSTSDQWGLYEVNPDNTYTPYDAGDTTLFGTIPVSP